MQQGEKSPNIWTVNPYPGNNGRDNGENVQADSARNLKQKDYKDNIDNIKIPNQNSRNKLFRKAFFM